MVSEWKGSWIQRRRCEQRMSGMKQHFTRLSSMINDAVSFACVRLFECCIIVVLN